MIVTRSNAKSSSISIIVTRANGRVERHGIVAYWHRNPILNFAGNFLLKLKKAFK